MQDIWQALPDPVKAALFTLAFGSLTVVGLACGITLWQVILDFLHPPTGEKFRSAVRSCFPPDDDRPRS